MWDYHIKDYVVDQTSELHYTCSVFHTDGRTCDDFSGNTNDPDNIRSVMADYLSKLDQIDQLKEKMDAFIAANLKGQKLPDLVVEVPVQTADEIKALKRAELLTLKTDVELGLADQLDFDAAKTDAKAAIETASQAELVVMR